MKFTDGFWALRPGVTARYAQEAYDIAAEGDRLVVTAPTRPIRTRGNVLNVGVLTVTLSAPAEGVIKVRIEHHTGGRPGPGFRLHEPGGAGRVETTDDGASLTTGGLRATIRRGAPWTCRSGTGSGV